MTDLKQRVEEVKQRFSDIEDIGYCMQSGVSISNSAQWLTLAGEIIDSTQPLITDLWQRVQELEGCTDDEECLGCFRQRQLRRCSPDVTPQEYLHALDNRDYVHPDSEAATARKPLPEPPTKEKHHGKRK